MKKYLTSKIKNFINIKKIRVEASSRAFYRIFFKRGTLVAMVYPEENIEEISKIVRLSSVYAKKKINTPEIKEIINNRIVLQEDLGDTLVQKAFFFSNIKEKQNILKKIAKILKKLREIPNNTSNSLLDNRRMKWEMDFFLKHFVQKFFPGYANVQELKNKLYLIVKKIKNINFFAHRDFHSRNMLYYNDKIYLVDIQDSLIAQEYYDTVSFAFDSYLDLGTLRGFFLDELKEKKFNTDSDQFYLTAIQRNIKALGTFGYQINVKKNLSYKKYINRTINHIRGNKLFEHFFDMSILEKWNQLKKNAY